VDYAYLVRSPGGEARPFFETRLVGLFSTDEWLAVIQNTGFKAGIHQDASGHKFLYGWKMQEGNE
jgi:hypothetical protein